MDLAIEIGKSSNYINSIENGKYFPSPETIEKIATVLKIEPMELFNNHDLKDMNDPVVQNSLDKMKNVLTERILKDINNTFNLLNDSKTDWSNV